ncbi:hypothetical protein EI94DRAFT_1704323 [Lactarius quietus]|nr:hypothetical protein EI94DRAFT_1704323 [Lactarius quietus]
MPKKKAVKCARLKNAANARQKRWIAEPATATPDGSNVPIPILERSLDLAMDLSSEGDGGGQYRDTGNVLRNAQEREFQAESFRKRTHLPSYPGQSERTQSRRKLANRKLAAQGFTTLPEFLKQTAEKQKRQARLAVLVAAATTATRSRSHMPERLDNGIPSGNAKIAPEPIEYRVWSHIP